jgi:hypothetical protein
MMHPPWEFAGPPGEFMFPLSQSRHDGKTAHFGAARSLISMGLLLRLEIEVEHGERIGGLDARADAELGEHGGDMVIDGLR